MVPSSRLAYRTRQFWNALLAPSNKRVETRDILPPLTSIQVDLFRSMHLSEQVHAYRVFRRLQADGHRDPDLLIAALLHDVGKSLHPLSAVDRAAVVLGQRLFPRLVKHWGRGDPRGLRRAFVVAEQHAAWGADLVAATGASSRTVELVRRHQDAELSQVEPSLRPLLAALQAADDES